MTTETTAFDSLKDVFAGVTFEGNMKRLSFMPMDAMTVAETMPKPLKMTYGEGSPKICPTETNVRMVYGHGSAKVFNPDSLSLMLHLNGRADAKATSKTLAGYFSAQGVRAVSIDSQSAGKTTDIEVKLPLTAEAFDAGRKLATALVQKFGQ